MKYILLNANDKKIKTISEKLQKTSRFFYFISDHNIEGINKLFNIVIDREHFIEELKEISKSDFFNKHEDVACYIVNPFSNESWMELFENNLTIEYVVDIPDNKIIGVTGPTGSGKSTICNILANKGYLVISADKVAREVSKDKTVLKELTETFGDVLDEAGNLNRKRMAEIAFESKGNVRALNKIMHPRIIKRMFEEAKMASDNTRVVFDAPQLLEADLDKYCDLVVSVKCTIKTMKDRIMKRDGLTPQQADSRIYIQYPWVVYEKASDIIINGEEDLDRVKTQLSNFGLIN